MPNLPTERVSGPTCRRRRFSGGSGWRSPLGRLTIAILSVWSQCWQISRVCLYRDLLVSSPLQGQS
eukprot:1344005-Alexandrium_andersonii.AAC.1